MTISVVGALLIPAGLLIAVFGSSRILLYLLIFFAPFTATAVVNVQSPSFGLQPAYFFGLLFVGRFGAETLLRGGRVTLGRTERRALLILWLFLLAVVVSILAIPVYDHVMVVRPSGQLEALRFTSENVSQLLYVAVAVALVTAIAFSRPRPVDVRRGLLVLLAGGVFVSLWGWLQIYLYRLGLPYPDFLFNNSLSYSQRYEQVLGVLGLKRMNSVAAEPSMLARFLLIPTFISYYCVVHRGFLLSQRMAVALAILFSLTLLATTSTTAFLGLLAGFGVFYLIALRSNRKSPIGISRRRRRRTILLLAVVTASLPVLAYAAARIYLGLSAGEVADLLNVVLLQKLESQSGQSRWVGALNGLSLFASHPILGVGWGSNRTFDLTTNLLSTTGLVGTLLFVWAHFEVVGGSLRVDRRRRRVGGIMDANLARVLALALLVVLVGKMISEPGLAYLDHWILVGLMAGILDWNVSEPEYERSARHASSRGKVRHAPVP